MMPDTRQQLQLNLTRSSEVHAAMDPMALPKNFVTMDTIQLIDLYVNNKNGLWLTLALSFQTPSEYVGELPPDKSLQVALDESSFASVMILPDGLYDCEGMNITRSNKLVVKNEGGVTLTSGISVDSVSAVRTQDH